MGIPGQELTGHAVVRAEKVGAPMMAGEKMAQFDVTSGRTGLLWKTADSSTRGLVHLAVTAM